MQLSSGTRLGPYRVDAAIGVGGMGEVYRATDTRLDRSVAIKVLTGELAADPMLHARFEREAKAISSLNHSNICALYDVGEAKLSEGAPLQYLVMEYLDGETLETRIGKGALPVEQVLRIGIEIADALDKAHRRGIVHRDLKPGNVMLTKSGAKLLDFGLARTSGEYVEASVDGATAMRPLTREGTLVGTYQYMSPEQLEGNAADARSDLFALGAMLYEMLTGRRAFDGKSRASIIASILAGEITPISEIKPLVPPALDRVVRVCLAKDPDERWQTAHDVMLQLRWVAEGGSKAGVAAPVARRRMARESIAWIVAAAMAVAAMAATFAYVRARSKPQPSVHFTLDLPDRVALFPFDERGIALSPDGSRLVYAASDKARRTLFVRPLASEAAQRLDGTDNASYPFWSADGRFIAFFADGKLKKIAADGGPVQVICDAPSGRGGTWNAEGTILFEPTITSPLSSVPAGGGTPVPATALKGDSRHRWPWFLPDGKHFLVTGDANVFIGELGNLDVKKLIDDASNATFVLPDRVVFARAATLMTQEIDLRKLVMKGDATPLPVGRVAYWAPKRYVVFSTSVNGTMAFLPSVETSSRLLWVDRSGRALDSIGEPAFYQDAVLSPDGSRVAVVKGSPAEGDIWIVDVAAQRWARATFMPGSYGDLAWSHDGSKLAFMYLDKGVGQTFVKTLARDDAPEAMTAGANFAAPFSFSPDGGTLLIGRQSPATQWDLFSIDVHSKGEGKPLVVTPYSEARARFSPDGKWFAYDSSESGRSEIYVRRFPPTADQWQVSTEGGTSPFWSADGRELYFVGPESLMSVPIAGGERLNPGTARALFPVQSHWRAGSLLTSGPLGSVVCGVTPDGQKFLFQSTEGDRLASIHVVVNANPLLGVSP